MLKDTNFTPHMMVYVETFEAYNMALSAFRNLVPFELKIYVHRSDL